MTPVPIPCSGTQTILLARRTPTVRRWSFDARSEGWYAYPLWRE